MKYLPYVLILILSGIITYLYFSNNKVDTSKFINKIDSLSTLVRKDKATILKLLKDAKTSEIAEINSLRKADSLAKIISNLNIESDCPEIAENQSKEIVVLRDGLKKCNKSKGIYKVSLGICHDIVIKNELILVETSNMQKVSKKAVRKAKVNAFIFGSGSTLIIIITILLLL